MKKLISIVLVALFITNASYSQNEGKIEELKREIQKVSESQKRILSELEKLRKENKVQNTQIGELQSQGRTFVINLDSLSCNIQSLAKVQNNDRLSFKNDIKETNTNIATNLVKMDSRTMWGGILLLCTILGFSGYLYVKRRKDYTSMSEVRKAQDALQIAQSKMQEDSIKLDNQMLALMERQMNATPAMVSAGADHSLALKVADEIVRIELNLSRMDASVKGYKQLAKAVERIKNNFQANGYEIIDMLGKSYNEGMKVVANFVPDETLKEGEQIITGVTKPQINYNGKMIQSAQITVSQNI